MSDEMGSSILRFSIRPQDTKLDEAAVHRLLEEATQEAEAEARKEHAVSAQAKVPGAFGGVGETIIVVHLLLPYLAPLVPYLAEAGKAVLHGTLTAAGEYFFKRYLAPGLRKRNLLPSAVKVETGDPAPPPAPKAPAAAKGAPNRKPGHRGKPAKRKN